MCGIKHFLLKSCSIILSVCQQYWLSVPSTPAGATANCRRYVWCVCEAIFAMIRLWYSLLRSMIILSWVPV
jgi:hypothetical protein